MSKWVRCPQANPRATLRLFCLPYAGGSASIFRDWPGRLPSEIQVCAIQLPGRQSRIDEAPFTALLPLVRVLAQHLTPYLDLPYAIFGHSMGALIGFELVRQLRREYDTTPVGLIVSAHRAPHVPSRHPPIHLLPEFAFINVLRQLSGFQDEILRNAELMKLLLPTLYADYQLSETYKYLVEKPLACPITAYGGVQDRRVNYNDLTAWRYLTSRKFRLRMFPGDHFYLNTVQPLLLQAITQDLEWCSRHSNESV